jgi:heme/copper-type cytochrome/quinol oxidase subunit 2
MLQLITLLGVGLYFVLLYFRYRSQSKQQPRRNILETLMTAKVLLIALAVWLMVSFKLQHTLAKLDGTHSEPQLLERIASFFSRL